MNDYTRTEQVTKTVSYGLPSGTPYSELIKLYNIARRELESTREKGATIYDDDIRVVSWDEEIRLVFKVDVETKSA